MKIRACDLRLAQVITAKRSGLEIRGIDKNKDPIKAHVAQAEKKASIYKPLVLESTTSFLVRNLYFAHSGSFESIFKLVDSLLKDQSPVHVNRLYCWATFRHFANIKLPMLH